MYPYTRKRRDEKSRSVGELDDVYKLKEAEEVTKPKTPSLQGMARPYPDRLISANQPPNRDSGTG